MPQVVLKALRNVKYGGKIRTKGSTFKANDTDLEELLQNKLATKVSESQPSDEQPDASEVPQDSEQPAEAPAEQPQANRR